MWFEAFRQVVSVLTDAGPTGLLVGTGALAGVLLIAVLAAGVVLSRRATSVTPVITRRALRECAGRTGVPRHRDPDAAGRTRPRGPTGLLAAA
ncbi:hypothetical protein BG844_33985 [Couchioplanes caeruleus subsp. caeruleus]|uniref:Uncharacterized protein n=1 Tax=Couchioplanes caeruleus subsp. caeruleus TaxID=56427 RepID=A0A1K0FB99_9ACTN|nr:hypothetical protein BG844_33985 [Couchioplanes caeruleus subsp. caeruleus]